MMSSARIPSLRKCSFEVLDESCQTILSCDIASQTSEAKLLDSCEITDISIACSPSSSIPIEDVNREFWKSVALQRQRELEVLQSENSKLESLIFEQEEKKRVLTEKFENLLATAAGTLNSPDDSPSDSPNPKRRSFS